MVHAPLSSADRAVRRTRVLHVIQNLNYGGMERLVAEMVRRADRDRFEMHVLALQYLGRFAKGLEQFADMHLSDPLPRWTMLWTAPLASQIRKIGPDVVHTHSGVWYKASLAARHAGVPHVVHTEHGRRSPDPWLNRFIDARAARRTGVVVAVSQILADQVAAIVGAGGPQIRVVLNGVDTDVYRPRSDNGAIRRALGLPGGVPIIGSVGRLEGIKGYDVMIEAYGYLLRGWGHSEPSPALVLVGDGAERGRLDELARAHGLGGNARLLGWRDDIHDLHASFTLFTMSSRSEGTSVSLLEAMGAGLCPVVTDVGGNAAVLGEELRHRLVPSQDPRALAAAWGAALKDPTRRGADARTARRRVEARFGVDAMVRQYEATYESLRCHEGLAYHGNR